MKITDVEAIWLQLPEINERADGTQDTLGHQSIAVLNLSTNQIADFPDARLPEDAHQSYFIGLAFSSDGKHLYASVGSLTDPTGARSGSACSTTR